jgi:hypothetical protein
MTNIKEDDDPLVKRLIIFPAYEVGHSEFISFLNSMEDTALIDRILFICSPDLYAAFHSRLIHCIVDNFKSIPSLIIKIESWAHKNHASFKAIMGIDEEEQFSLSKHIARHFGLEFHNDKTCSMASNKFLLKTFFKKNRVPTGRFTLISKFDENIARYIGFPNILKVLSGNGSAYLFKNESMRQLKDNLAYLKKAVQKVNGDSRFRKQTFDMGNESITLDPKRQFLLEEFIGGEEFSCDFIKHPDDVQVIRVVKKFKGPYVGYFKGYLLLKEEEIKLNGIDLPYLTEICRRIAKTFAINTGVCMMDFKLHKKKIKVIESSIRPGLSAFNHLMYEIYGYTSLALMAKQKFGMNTDVRFPDENGAVVYLFGKEKTSPYYVDTSEIEKLKQQYNITYIHTFEDSGNSNTDTLCDRSGLLKGYVLLKNPDASHLPELADLLNEKVKYIDYIQGNEGIRKENEYGTDQTRT